MPVHGVNTWLGWKWIPNRHMVELNFIWTRFQFLCGISIFINDFKSDSHMRAKPAATAHTQKKTHHRPEIRIQKPHYVCESDYNRVWMHRSEMENATWKQVRRAWSHNSMRCCVQRTISSWPFWSAFFLLFRSNALKLLLKPINRRLFVLMCAITMELVFFICLWSPQHKKKLLLQILWQDSFKIRTNIFCFVLVGQIECVMWALATIKQTKMRTHE